MSTETAPSPTPLVTPTPTGGETTFYVAPDGDDAQPGTRDAPWATIEHAAQTLRAGQTVYIRGGTYRLDAQVRVRNSGTAEAWITFAGYPSERTVLDARDVASFAPASTPPYPQDQGAFQIEGVSYIRVQNLTIQNSHNAGFTIRDSQHVELYNNRTHTTFSSGIAAWDTDHDGKGCEHITIKGNTVTRANTWEMLLPGQPRGSETPHEAISIAGAHHFEVAYNHVHDCDKEGIDVKETSRHGTVHHNYIHHLGRQGLYVDSWFGVLQDIELYENVVHDCRGAGIAVSVEGGNLATDIRIHHNLVHDNLGTGILFARWGGDGLRTAIRIDHNTIHHNGYGPAQPETGYHWITGGLYLYSANLQDIEIRDNILSDNRGFQIGYSDHYLSSGDDIAAVMAEKQIAITHNLIWDRNEVEYPIYAGWGPDDYADIYAWTGDDEVTGDPLFVDAAAGDYRLSAGSPAIGAASPDSGGDVGAFAHDAAGEFWWRRDFPPSFVEPQPEG